jgi:RNA-binding protein YlmH
MNKEEQMFFNHIKESADNCYRRGIPVYTDFLNLNEQTVFLSNMSEFSHVRTFMDGGYEGAERKIVCFLPAHEEECPPRERLPIIPLKIQSSAGKFSVSCTHRDYLGAVLNLGIDRGQIGDLIVGECHAHLLCTKTMAGFLIENLISVKRNPVRCIPAEFSDLEGQLVLTEVTGTLASLRMDSLLAFFLKSSRSAAILALDKERVFVNGKLCISHIAEPKEGDIISVRKTGRFIFDGVLSSTKKGRLLIKIRKYS